MKVSSAVKVLWSVLWTLAIYPVVVLFPRNRKKVVFGAWFGKQYADNPKYFMLYLLSLDKGFKCVWIGEDSVREKLKGVPGVTFARKGSWCANWHVLTAKWLCCTITANSDVTSFPTFGRIKMLNFWHGTMYKGECVRMGKASGASRLTLRQICFRIYNRFQAWARPQWCYSSLSYELMCDRMAIGDPHIFRRDKSIAKGTPRIDYLIRNAENTEEIRCVRSKLAQLLGLPLDKKWFVYMPTWRKGLSLKFSFMTSGRIAAYQRVLTEKNAVIIEKQHPQVVAALGLDANRKGDIYQVSADAACAIDTQELLLAADGLITDYSSCFCDYLVLNRPIIHFAYDYDWYVGVERGVEFDLRDVAGGPVAFDEGELLSKLALSSGDMLRERGKNALSLVEGEKGRASETFAKYVGLI